ncbi:MULTISPECIES: formyltransferase family protein [Methylobacterium]|uniref:Methionyl-tRNA formyltransferase n=1 Tax=Methylobacterium bullatum TaxID=570505 RepID=A0AAV4Z3T8_9HYPH|nr:MULTISPECIES: formyltransferase family protein [Methylobacterium]MBD8903359.1 formyl transferase [Methylobacterium bullatum]TXN30129.1 formyl transferase [Methylobacterium sp. WL19]GJD38109.1 Methionyl-tRNA formyltransferase [Methylobacterium bullatum]
MTRPRIALFVLEALPNARAVRRFVRDHAEDIAFVGLSNAERPSSGGLSGQVRRHLARSGPAFLPYLAVNFGLPDLLAPASGLLRRLTGAGDATTATPLKALCRTLGIPTLRIDDVNGPDAARAFEAHAPDLIVAFHFDQIFSAATLSLAPLGGLNLHPGLLPRHRGPVPTIHALAEENPAFGVTIHRLTPAIDAGAILAQEASDLPSGTTATRAAILLHERGRILLDRVLDEIASDTLKEGITPEALPYCHFPDRALLTRLASQGRKLIDSADLRAALGVNAKA